MENTADLPTSVPELHDLIFALQEEKNTLESENSHLKQKYYFMLEQFKLAQQRKFARSLESNVLQYEMQFDEAEAVPAEEAPEEENTISVTYTRSKAKRRTLPDNLPREVIEH